MPNAGNPAKSILIGIALIGGGALCFLFIVGNPFDDLALIRRGKTAPGFIVDTWEDVQDDDEGGEHWFHAATYQYTLPNGRTIEQQSSGSGQLDDEFRDLQQPFPIEVEYLPDNPQVSRIKGEGSPTLFDWAWRKAGLGLLMLALFTAPGIGMLRDGIRAMREQTRGDARSIDKRIGNRTVQPIA